MPSSPLEALTCKCPFSPVRMADEPLLLVGDVDSLYYTLPFDTVMLFYVKDC